MAGSNSARSTSEDAQPELIRDRSQVGIAGGDGRAAPLLNFIALKHGPALVIPEPGQVPDPCIPEAIIVKSAKCPGRDGPGDEPVRPPDLSDVHTRDTERGEPVGKLSGQKLVGLRGFDVQKGQRVHEPDGNPNSAMAPVGRHTAADHELRVVLLGSKTYRRRGRNRARVSA